MNSVKLGSFPYKSGFPTCLEARYSLMVLGLFPMRQWAWGWPSGGSWLGQGLGCPLSFGDNTVCVCVWGGGREEGVVCRYVSVQLQAYNFTSNQLCLDLNMLKVSPLLFGLG